MHILGGQNDETENGNGEVLLFNQLENISCILSAADGLRKNQKSQLCTLNLQYIHLVAHQMAI